MAINQNDLSEIRYIKRQNLEQESKMVGNWYRDLLRSYGVDCNYYKLKLPFPEVFHTVVNRNNVVRAAYGEDPDPDYKLSAEMITYMEVENDIFQLNKFGIVPNTNVNFYFDSTDFATSLAYRLGQYMEYPITTQVIEIDFTEDEVDDFEDLIVPFKCEILSGECSIPLKSSEIEIKIGEESKLDVEILSMSEPRIDFPVNENIYKSFNYSIKAKEADDVLLFFDFKITKNGEKNYKLIGKLHGVVLFRDLRQVSKYSIDIHPEVGDIITIDFPDAKSREQFEITEASDINLASDGINPLLHKYIWKCKAIRFVPNASNRIPEENLENSRLLEKFDFEASAQEAIAKKISEYPEEEDKIYGGYSRLSGFSDLNAVPESRKKVILDSVSEDGTLIDVASFADRSSLKTNGFDLYFIDSVGTTYKLTQFGDDSRFVDQSSARDIDFVKASNDMLVFMNVSGERKVLAKDVDEKEEFLELSASSGQVEQCLVSLRKMTTFGNGYNNLNGTGDTFYKFSNCFTMLMVVNGDLYCRFASGKIVKLN